MPAERVTTVTVDGLELHGGRFCPAGEPLGTVVLIHGFGGGGLDNSWTWVLGEALTAIGWEMLSGDNRGSGVLKNVLTPGRETDEVVSGAALEDVTESPLDVSAWMGCARSENVVLAGHSLGATKVLLSLQAGAVPRGAALLAPADMVALTLRSPGYDEMVREMESRQELELLEHLWDGSVPITPRGLRNYVRRGAPGDVVDASQPMSQSLRGIQVPLLLVGGTADTCLGVPMAQGLANLAEGHSGEVEVALLPGLDHQFAPEEDRMAEVFTDWVEALL